MVPKVPSVYARLPIHCDRPDLKKLPFGATARSERRAKPSRKFTTGWDLNDHLVNGKGRKDTRFALRLADGVASAEARAAGRGLEAWLKSVGPLPSAVSDIPAIRSIQRSVRERMVGVVSFAINSVLAENRAQGTFWNLPS
jgi:hypothetical protein